MTNDQPTTATTIGPVAVILRQCRRGFTLMVGLCVVLELLALAPMVYMWNTFDRVMTSRSVVTLLSLTVLILGVYLFSSAMEWARSRLMVRLSLRIDWDLAADVFDAAFRRQAHRKAVNVQQAMGDLLTLRQFLSGKGVLTVIAAPFALLFIAAGATFHPVLAIYSLGTALVMLIAAKANQQMTSSTLKASNNANHEATRMAAGLLRHSETTRALGMMPALRQRWHAQHRAFVALQVQASDAAGSGAGMTSFMQHSFQSVGMALGIFLAIEGLITGGMVMAASMLITKSVSPLQHLIAQWPSIVMARQAYDRLNKLLADDVRPADAMALPPPIGHLLVDNVSGAPEGAERAVVGGVSFELAAGQALAIVGPSAAGKTSLSKLLVGAWQPTQGSIRLDGVEISHWNPDELGPLIGYVPQEIEFFEGSVAENIARLATVDADAVVTAARSVGLHETILQWPKGYDTVLGESGFALSGGQRQRLAIARALYGNPRYVVMDEPNANLDEVGEQALIEAMRHLRTLGTTVIVTTHRPRLIGIVDLMLVLKSGRQVGFGPPKDLFEAVKRVQPAPAAVPPAVAARAQPAPQPQTGSAA
jgi:PrtD family type I secretion system ABC transporter